MKDEIKKFFKGEVEDDEDILKKYSRDASVFEVRPKLVLFPKDTEDVKSIVKWVNENSARQDLAEKYGKLSITARSAGTDMSGGPLNESLILDFTRHMNKLIGGPLPMKNNSEWEVVVQPGMFYRDFEKITLNKGLILPCYTASKGINAMGGMFGNNSAGFATGLAFAGLALAAGTDAFAFFAIHPPNWLL
jgi:FAD/FMN-containing dehydrogenase